MNKSVFLKTAAVIATLVLTFLSLCACAGKNNATGGKDLPKLIIGVDYYEPFVYRDEDGEFAGIDVDLAKEACRLIGYEPEFVHIEWSEKNAYLAEGKIDCIWCCFSETGREDEYSWTLPYMNSRQVVAVKKDSDITKISDLENKRVAVQSTTKADEIFSGKAGVEKLVVPQLKELNCFPNVNFLFAAINGGYVDAVAGHELVLIECMKSSSTELKILEEPLLEVQIGVAFLKDTRADAVSALSETFKLLKNNGYLADLVAAYGLDPDKYVVNYEEL